MSERDALLRAILEDPGDDTVRLVFADWLQENGEPERAEFVRDQVWLWSHPSCGSCTGREWAAGKPCAECAARELIRGRVGTRLFGLGRWREFAGPAAAVVPTGARWDDHIQFSRGFICRIDLSCRSFLEHAEALFSAHPITEVRLTDKTPWAVNSRTWAFVCYGDHETVAYDLPEGLWGAPVDGTFPTQGDSDKALSDRCVAVGRALAGLPDLEPRKAVTT